MVRADNYPVGMFDNEIIEPTSRHEGPTTWSYDTRTGYTSPERDIVVSKRMARIANIDGSESTAAISFSEYRHCNGNLTARCRAQTKASVAAGDKGIYVFKADILPSLGCEALD
jgi:hypothetical protein